MNEHEKLNYLEFPSRNIEVTKNFFSAAFNWHFVDYGAEYTAFTQQGLDGGFYLSDTVSTTETGAALAVFYSNNIEQTQSKIINAGGIINKAIFNFPGGKRFHFLEPSGNEFAVWSDCAA